MIIFVTCRVRECQVPKPTSTSQKRALKIFKHYHAQCTNTLFDFHLKIHVNYSQGPNKLTKKPHNNSISQTNEMSQWVNSVEEAA